MSIMKYLLIITLGVFALQGCSKHPMPTKSFKMVIDDNSIENNSN